MTPGSWLVSEYDVPADAWYLHPDGRNGAAYTTEMPYSVLMEIALQPCGFLSGYLGSTLADIGEDFYFRNLDGRGTLLRSLDVAGKRIAARIQLASSAAIQGAIIQKFTFVLTADGEPFYEGDAAFGYFSPGALANQLGFDNGQHIPNWYETAGRPAAGAMLLDLTNPTICAALAGTPDRPEYRVDGRRLQLLDRLVIVPDGGRHGRGYLWAERAINPHDWFFKLLQLLRGRLRRHLGHPLPVLPRQL
jgi:hypothetical protein